ncbi:MAG TPA: CCA tRNA nucleotidyltransferase [Bacillus bacterium]|nr:CCA tRNA nucleotidyltransferase [Bacillus sp. (in: firmicutes)]
MEGPFIKAKAIIEKLNEAGYEAYFVGGSVRDFLLNRPIDDVDIATSALPEEVEALFPKTIPVGLKHGTVVVIHEDECYEVTTFRVDGDYQDFRRPSKVEFVSSLEADLRRRDFTINAIAMNYQGSIIDPLRGEKDLHNKYIQTVGDADERLLEDPLRMMRACRFVSQLNFELSEDTKKSIKKNASYLSKISVERILIEFEKLLTGKAIKKAVKLIIELGLYQYLPQLSNKEKELHLFAEVCSNKVLNLDEMWTLLLVILKVENIDGFFKQWKNSNERMKACQRLLNAHEQLQKSAALSAYDVYTYSFEVLKSSIKLYCIVENKQSEMMLSELQEIYDKLPILSRKQLAITGNDLMTIFNKRGGPWLSKTIEMVERAVVNGTVVNNKADIKEWLLTCNPQLENNY